MENIDFRIGNYLLDRENRLCKVEELSCREGEREVYAPAIVGGITGLPNKPIPLTEEWLIKFGFKNEIKIDRYLVNDWRFHLEKPRNYDGFLLCEDHLVITEVDYVHQLQNLYFALTGEDLNTQY